MRLLLHMSLLSTVFWGLGCHCCAPHGPKFGGPYGGCVDCCEDSWATPHGHHAHGHRHKHDVKKFYRNLRKQGHAFPGDMYAGCPCGHHGGGLVMGGYPEAACGMPLSCGCGEPMMIGGMMMGEQFFDGGACPTCQHQFTPHNQMMPQGQPQMIPQPQMDPQQMPRPIPPAPPAAPDQPLPPVEPTISPTEYYSPPALMPPHGQQFPRPVQPVLYAP